MKYQTNSLQEFFAAKGVNYYLAIAKVIFSRVNNMLFSGVKIICFCAKAHLIYPFRLHNKKSIFLVKYWAKYIPCWRVTVSFIGPTSLYCDPLFVWSTLAFTLDTIAVLCHSSPSGSSLISKIWKSIAVRYAAKVKQFTQSRDLHFSDYFKPSKNRLDIKWFVLQY